MSTAVDKPSGVKQAGTALTIKEQLNNPDMIAQIARVIPKHLTAERMARVATTALMRTPNLAKCTPQSFFGCLLNLSQWGLEPDGRRAHLIPYGDQCTVIVDYKGIVELCFRTGTVASIHADVVRRGDQFVYDNGHVTKHVPWFVRDPAERPEKPGDVFAAYCIVQMTSGTAKHEVMSKDEIEAIRGRSRSGNSGPWKTDWNEMAKKTVFRRCSKWLPWSAEIHDALNGDDDDDVPSDVELNRAQAGRTGNTLAELMAQHDGAAAPAIEVEARDPVQQEQSEESAKWIKHIEATQDLDALDAILGDLQGSNLSESEICAVVAVIDKRRIALKKK